MAGKSPGHLFSRFGTGIYTTATSSKADDYASQQPESGSRYKAMLLNEVVLGRSAELYADARTIIQVGGILF